MLDFRWRAGVAGRAAAAATAALLAMGWAAGCVEESVLSDTNITDPKLIRPYFMLSKSRDGKQTTYIFKGRIEDRKGDHVELRNGAVYLNDIRMKVEEEVQLFGESLPVYTLSSTKLRFKFDSLYTFKIVLSDGSEYASSIRTQAQDIVSSSVKKSNGNAEITWAGDSTGPFILKYTLNRDSTNIEREMTYVPAKYPDTIRIHLEGMKLVRYSLETKISGTVNPALRNGGTLTSTVRAVFQ